jgi:hypothetical protein
MGAKQSGSRIFAFPFKVPNLRSGLGLGFSSLGGGTFAIAIEIVYVGMLNVPLFLFSCREYGMEDLMLTPIVYYEPDQNLGTLNPYDLMDSIERLQCRAAKLNPEFIVVTGTGHEDHADSWIDLRTSRPKTIYVGTGVQR